MTLLVEGYRGNYVENKHYGAFAIVDAQGKCLDKQGDIERPIFARSALKLLQVLPLVETGAADHWDLSEKEITLSSMVLRGDFPKCVIEVSATVEVLDPNDRCSFYSPFCCPVWLCCHVVAVNCLPVSKPNLFSQEMRRSHDSSAVDFL